MRCRENARQDLRMVKRPSHGGKNLIEFCRHDIKKIVIDDADDIKTSKMKDDGQAVDLGLEHECNVNTSIDMTRSMSSSWNCPRDNGGCWSRSIGEPLHSRGTVVQSG